MITSGYACDVSQINSIRQSDTYICRRHQWLRISADTGRRLGLWCPWGSYTGQSLDHNLDHASPEDCNYMHDMNLQLQVDCRSNQMHTCVQSPGTIIYKNYITNKQIHSKPQLHEQRWVLRWWWRKATIVMTKYTYWKIPNKRNRVGFHRQLPERRNLLTI